MQSHCAHVLAARLRVPQFPPSQQTFSACLDSIGLLVRIIVRSFVLIFVRFFVLNSVLNRALSFVLSSVLNRALILGDVERSILKFLEHGLGVTNTAAIACIENPDGATVQGCKSVARHCIRAMAGAFPKVDI